jgi:hypothetical protein
VLVPLKYALDFLWPEGLVDPHTWDKLGFLLDLVHEGLFVRFIDGDIFLPKRVERQVIGGRAWLVLLILQELFQKVSILGFGDHKWVRLIEVGLRVREPVVAKDVTLVPRP